MEKQYKVFYKVYLRDELLYITIKIRGNGIRHKLSMPLSKCIKNTLYLRYGLSHELDIEELTSLENTNPKLYDLVCKIYTSSAVWDKETCAQRTADLINSEFNGDVSNLASEAAAAIVADLRKRAEKRRGFWDAANSLCTHSFWYERADN